MLTWCNPRTFIEVTSIIIENFDKDFDRYKLIKKRNKNKFCEGIILEILSKNCNEENNKLVHKILSDLEIDYDYHYSDYAGESHLKSMLAFSGDREILKDLLKKEENIQNYYWHGDFHVELYNIYASLGDYEESLTIFEKEYNYTMDFTEDYNEDLERLGYTHVYWGYEDGITKFIERLNKSFKIDNIEYAKQKEIIYRILNNKEVKYINLEETLPLVEKILTEEDYQELINYLMLNHEEGELNFITTQEVEKVFYRYKITKINEEEIEEILKEANCKTKKLTKTR